jgi:fatty acid desaturase
LLVLYLLPAIVAGNMHSWRKYIEHMGLTGSTVLGLTRTIVPSGWLGRFIAFTLYNVSYHSVHHYYARMPQASLPSFASSIHPQTPEEQTLYPSYWSALWAMLPTLSDPKVGSQWRLRHEQPENKATQPAAPMGS